MQEARLVQAVRPEQAAHLVQVVRPEQAAHLVREVRPEQETEAPVKPEKAKAETQQAGAQQAAEHWQVPPEHRPGIRLTQSRFRYRPMQYGMW